MDRIDRGHDRTDLSFVLSLLDTAISAAVSHPDLLALGALAAALAARHAHVHTHLHAQLVALLGARARHVLPPAPVVAEDAWLSPKEAAASLRWSVKTLSRRWRSLPFCFPNPRGRGFLVSRRRLTEWQRRAEEP